MNTVDALADGNILLWREVMQMRYETVFVKLMMNKEIADYQEKFHEVIKNK